MSVQDASATEATEVCVVPSTARPTSGVIDTATFAYIRKHHFASITHSIAQVIGGLDGDLLRPSQHCKTVEPVSSATAALTNITPPLQLLLSCLTTPASPFTPSKGMRSGTKSVARAGSVPGASTEGGAAVSNTPSSALEPHGCLWPIDAAFATKEDAAKAEVCRCIALHCERLLTGARLVECFSGGLCWAHLASSRESGGERLGVALVLFVFRCWEGVVVPLLQSIMAHASPGVEVFSVELNALLNCLVKRNAKAMSPSSEVSSSVAPLAYKETVYWCFALLCGTCHDFPETVWASILRAAQDAAVQEQSSSQAGCLPPLTSETILLRSFIAHLSCSTADADNILPASALAQPHCDDIIASHMSVAVTAARACTEAWICAEPELLQQGLSDATAPSFLLPVLLRTDGYWAVLMEPYTAMLAHYYLR